MFRARPERVTGFEVTGHVELHRDVYSHVLDNERHVVVYLPPDYHGPEAVARYRRYPVLYLQDGQNVFDTRTAAFGVKWNFDGHAQQMIARGEIEPLIMVGIYNTGARLAEYTPAWAPPPGPLASPAESKRLDDYARFVVDELKPLIDATYRTRSEGACTGLVGSSMGGLSALYMGLRYPRVFGRVAAVSPSLWFGTGRMLREIHEARQFEAPERLWISAGTAEGRRPGSDFSFAIAGIRRLRELLEAHGLQTGRHLFYHEAQGGSHDEASWSKQVPAILRSLYGAEGAPVP